MCSLYFNDYMIIVLHKKPFTEWRSCGASFINSMKIDLYGLGDILFRKIFHTTCSSSAHFVLHHTEHCYIMWIRAKIPIIIVDSIVIEGIIISKEILRSSYNLDIWKSLWIRASPLENTIIKRKSHVDTLARTIKTTISPLLKL